VVEAQSALSREQRPEGDAFFDMLAIFWGDLLNSARALASKQGNAPK
jgi:hypothetical protein